MSFANPAAWSFAALAIPVILLYVLKIRLRRVPVSTTIFWEQVFEEKKPRAWWRRLRHLFSLLLQLAFLALLVSALTDPVLEWGGLEPRRTIIVLDNSASMQAEDVEGGRFARAHEQAGRLIGDLRTRDSMALIAAGTEPTVICGMTSHQRTLREALDGVTVGDGPTRVAEAVALARRILAHDEEADIIVLSDGGFAGARELAEAEDVTFLRVGQSADNVGITQFQVRRSLVDPVGYEILAEVTNFGREKVECHFDFELGGQVLDVFPVVLEPGQRWQRVFEKTSTEGGTLTGRIDVEDALAVDDRAVALLPARRPVQVAVGGEPNLFLYSVLDANPLVAPVRIDDLATIPAADCYVFHQKAPDPLPPGPVMIIDPAEATALFEVGEPIASPLVTEQDRESPLMHYVELENVFIPEARAVKAKGPAHRLAASLAEDPIYLKFDRPQGDVLMLAVNLTKTDLPLRTAFPIMMANALNWFSGSKGELRESLSSGQVTHVGVEELDLRAIAQRQGLQPQRLADPARDPESGEAPSQEQAARVGLGPELVLGSPDGRRERLRARGDRVTIGPLDRCGLWAIAEPQETDAPPEEDEDEGTRVALALERPDESIVLAVNLADEIESDLRVDTTIPEAEVPATAGFGGKPIWFYLVAVALLLSTLEWGMYHRRRVE